jgi:hypothetical protein
MPTTATVTIADLPAVTVSAFDSSASETGLDPGTFRLTRNGSTASTLTVSFTLTGTAVNGTDYANTPLTVMFQAGDLTADVVVTPILDASTEGFETVILKLTDGELYDLGTPNAAIITISD